MQQLHAQRHVVELLWLAQRTEPPNDQRQRGPQALARSRQNGRQHRPQQRIVVVGKLREPGLNLAEAGLDHAQDGADGIWMR